VDKVRCAARKTLSRDALSSGAQKIGNVRCCCHLAETNRHALAQGLSESRWTG
jgi:hypothetical protein